MQILPQPLCLANKTEDIADFIPALVLSHYTGIFYYNQLLFAEGEVNVCEYSSPGEYSPMFNEPKAYVKYNFQR